MAQVGRISGPLLFANLERNGIDLAFRNTLDDTELLYLDVVNGKIGVNTDTPSHTLQVNGSFRTGLQSIENQGTFGDLSFENSDINNLTGDINLKSKTLINVSNFGTDSILISDNTISTFASNSNLDLDTNGTGTVEVLSNLNIHGNLHATGNITFDGSIEFGDSTDDSTYPVDTVEFNSDLDSSIFPDESDTYNLGTNLKRWQEIKTLSLNADDFILSNNVNLDGIDPLTLRQGNILYVAQNGDDNNAGDHPNGPFKTLKRALEFADASTQGPVQIFIYAGGYEEELPLEVPSQVSIIGEDMRNTIIRPESAYQSEDVFLLNGESTVQNLTIKDFYYDSLNNTGHAFRFAPNTIVTTRSPYVQNVTVITQGTTTTSDDPRGFASGDAGRGAYIDGADVLSASEEASMLFHSSTFITPGVDAITMTNGVRVEWLNSFTYFANRGLYAVDGVTGHLSTDGSTVKYGAELRSIGSANVYGNYGAVADGADTLMYLIMHNFAYIGLGKFVDNDPSRAIQSQEVSELNSGKIYYQSIDHLGNFRVGNNFNIDQETGETNLVLTEADIDSLNGMVVTTGGNQTIITGEKIETGNLEFRNNTIRTTSGDFNVTAASGEINLQSSTNISKNLTMTGNLTFDGSLITLGNEPDDTVDFNTPFSQDIEPDISGAYRLGSPSKKWSKIWTSQAQISDIKIQDNFITTTLSNADLEFRANASGKIYLPNNDLNITNNLRVSYGDSSKSGLTDLQDTIIVGSITHTGDKTSVGNYNISNNFTLQGNIDSDSNIQYEEILFTGNLITTTTSNADLEFRASGSGNVYVPNNNVTFTNNLNAQDVYSSDINVDTNITSVELFASNNIQFRDNFIATTDSNSNLEFRANGTGEIYTANKVQIDNNLNVDGSLTFTGNLTGDDILGVTNLVSDQFYAEKFKTDWISIWDNNIATVVSNADLELRAAGAGYVNFELSKIKDNELLTDSLPIQLTPGDQQLTILSEGAVKLPVGSTAQRLLNKGDIRFNSQTQLFEGYGTSNIGFGGVFSDDMLTSLTVDQYSNNIRMLVSGDNNPVDSTALIASITDGLYASKIDVGDVKIDGDAINTSLSNSSLEIQSSGTGEVIIDNLNFIDNRIKNTKQDRGIYSINHTRYGHAKFNNNYGVVIPSGSTIESGEYQDRINILNVVSIGVTTVIELASPHNLGTGDSVYISQVESSLDDNLELLNTDDSSSPGVHGIVSAPTATRLEVAVDTSGANLANYIPNTGFIVAKAQVNPPVGDTRWNTDVQILETWDGEQYIAATGTAAAISQAEYDDILLEYTLALG